MVEKNKKKRRGKTEFRGVGRFFRLAVSLEPKRRSHVAPHKGSCVAGQTGV